MLIIAISFFLGDTWVQCVPLLTATWLLVPIICTWIVAALIRRRITTYASVAFTLGVIWATTNGWWQLRDDLQPTLEDRDIAITGTITSIPQQEPYGLRFVFTTDSNEQARIPSKLQISWYSNNVQVHAGERWQLKLKLKRRHGFANPGGFDYDGQLFREGIGATGYVRESPDNKLLGIAAGNLILRIRASLIDRIAAAIPASTMQGVIRGLAVGDQQAITADQWQVFSRTGISHLIAISGSHIGMVAFAFAWFGGFLIYLPAGQRWKLTRPDLQAMMGLPAALGYSLLAGMSVPTLRTLVMIAVFFVTRMLRREVDVWHSYGIALLLVTLIDPFAPLAVGTWLSFGAVAVILLNQQGRVGNQSWWKAFLSLQVVVTVGLVPLVVGAFGNVSLISPWINLIAIPVFTVLLVPAVLIGCALLVITPTFGTWWMQQLDSLLMHMYGFLQSCAATPMATWFVPQSPWWAMGLLLLGALLMVVPWWPSLRVSGVVCCLPAILWRSEPLPTGAFSITALDVGQGLSVVVQTSSHVLVYDTGPKFQSGTDTGSLVVLPYLRAKGIRNIDSVMISHGDDDHAGGMRSIEIGMPVQLWLLGPSVNAETISASSVKQRCQQGQQWWWDEVQFDVLYPDDFAGNTRNNSSCVLRVSAKGGSALLLGDAESPAEQHLISEGRIEPATIVVAGHHGSRSSSTPDLVGIVHAQQVIFSAGYHNRWGFPKSDIVERWQQSGARANSTIDAGAITVRVLPQHTEAPEWYRLSRRRYWQSE